MPPFVEPWPSSSGALDEEGPKPQKRGRRALIPEEGFPNFPKWVQQEQSSSIPKPPASLVCDQQLVRSAATQAAR